MNKKVLIGSFLALIAAVSVFAQQPVINITAPASGTSFLKGATLTIRWTHSAYYDAHPTQHCLLYCNWVQIGTPVQVIKDQFTWTVGQKSDGTWLEPGTYEITLESLDYDDLDGPNITIFTLGFKPEFLRLPMEFNKVPDCPMCYKFDPRVIGLEMEGLESVRLELWQGSRKLADLGKFAAGKAQSGPVKCELEPLAQGRSAPYELRVFSEKNALLLKQTIQVALKGR